jgi:hypothetical protein
VLRSLGDVIVLLVVLGAAFVAVAEISLNAATSAEPIPQQPPETSCTADKLLAAARDSEPIYTQTNSASVGNQSPSNNSPRAITPGACAAT